MDTFKRHIIHVLEKEGINDANIEIPPDTKLGDFAFPCFNLAKAHKKSPVMIAKELAEKIKPDAYIEKIISTGPYTNFFLKKEKLAEKVLEIIKEEKDDYGQSKTTHKTVMVEFSSPNTNKPLHLGHLRNNFLGESICRINEANGNKVIRSCVVNDKGVHISKSMLAYQKWGDDKAPDKKSDHYVGDFYVLFAQKAKDNPELEKEAQDLLLKFEQKDKETIQLWKKMNKWVYDGFEETYKRIGIKFDKVYYESNMYKEGKEIILHALEKDIFSKDEKGNIIAQLEQYNLPNKVVLRADGTTVYMTQDIYLAKLKFEDYKLERSIYVVGSEQILHFQILFKILELLHIADTKKTYHLSYGMVNLPEGKMKSREGTVVDADDLLDELERLATEELQKRYTDLDDKEFERRAKIISLAALRFFMLKQDAAKDMIYNPKESLSFEGETGPYLLYTYARIKSILAKADHHKKTIDPTLFDDKEKQLLIQLLKFIDIVKEAYKDSKPSLISRYVLDLSQLFNEYYQDHPILKADEGIMHARLQLISAIAQVLKNGLTLLGIETLEQM